MTVLRGLTLRSGGGAVPVLQIRPRRPAPTTAPKVTSRRAAEASREPPAPAPQPRAPALTSPRKAAHSTAGPAAEPQPRPSRPRPPGGRPASGPRSRTSELATPAPQQARGPRGVTWRKCGLPPAAAARSQTGSLCGCLGDRTGRPGRPRDTRGGAHGGRASGRPAAEGAAAAARGAGTVSISSAKDEERTEAERKRREIRDKFLSFQRSSKQMDPGGVLERDRILPSGFIKLSLLLPVDPGDKTKDSAPNQGRDSSEDPKGTPLAHQTWWLASGQTLTTLSAAGSPEEHLTPQTV
ncbi:uncharacterized protein AAEQ78_016662 [Lycaon pictus]